jgi:hypothetical protein
VQELLCRTNRRVEELNKVSDLQFRSEGPAWLTAWRQATFDFFGLALAIIVLTMDSREAPSV